MFVGGFIEKRLRVDDAVGAVAVHGVLRLPRDAVVGIFAAGYPTGLEGVDSSLGGQMMGIMTFFPLGLPAGYFIAWGLRKINLLRVPPEVELEGLDQAEFGVTSTRVRSAPESIVMPDGKVVEAAPVLAEAYGAGAAMSGTTQLILAIVTQVAVVGFLFRWMFHKDHRLREERRTAEGRREPHGA